MNDLENYVKQLEQVIARFLEPIGDIPFPVVVKALTGCNVLAFDLSFKQNEELLERLSMAAQISGKTAFHQGIFTARPNEAGNQMEPFVLKALREVGFRADKPISRSGKKKVAGYPDIQAEDQYGRIVYLECKTYSTKTKGQRFRTFYFSPSEDPKITRDAFHILMSFELNEAQREGKKAFVPISWHIYTLDKLLLHLKREFNASNKELYTPGALLAEGRIG